MILMKDTLGWGGSYDLETCSLALLRKPMLAVTQGGHDHVDRKNEVTGGFASCD